jgi:predicted metal-dependent hydrolase
MRRGVSKSNLLKTTDHLQKVSFGSEKISYSLEYRNRKSLAISVHPDLTVSVIAPEGQSIEKISARVKKRAPWILKQRHYFSKFLPKQPARRYVSGETHKYLGRHYRLKVLTSKIPRVRLKRGYLIVHTQNRSDSVAIKKLVTAWYRFQAEKHFNESLKRCLPLFRKLEISTPEVRMKHMSKRWGSCTSSAIIYLNPDLIKSPKSCIDYVMVHELCHLKIRDHSKKYYRLLKKLMPDWEKRKLSLESN